MTDDTARKSKGKKTGNKYPGTDSQGWVVKTAAPLSVQDKAKGAPTFDGFKAANAAAQTIIETTGVHAAAVRA